MGDSKKNIDSLQLLRVIAVSLVVLLHAASNGVTKFSVSNPFSSCYHLGTWGAIGVDLFFSISGFIMTIVIPSYVKPGGWKTFFVKRAVRILPLYYLLSALLVFTTIFLHHEVLDIKSVVKTVVFFPLFDKGTIVSPLMGVGWSLSYEIYFYTLIGILLVFKKDIYRRMLLLIAVLSIMGLSISTESPLLKFLTSPVLLEFGFGILCGLTYKRFNLLELSSWQKKAISLCLLITGLALMCVTIFVSPGFNLNSITLVQNVNEKAFYRAMLWGLPSAIFMLGTVLSMQSFKKSTPAILVLAGDASYSCYLIHTKLYLIIAFVFKSLSMGPVVYLVVIVPACLLISIVFYKLVEKPLIKGVERVIKYADVGRTT
jgi:exopolysaccharide production protein ExoZ